MSNISYLVWKDDGSTMSWDHFSWDTVTVLLKPMKNLKIGLDNPDAVILQTTDTFILEATGDAALNSPPITLAALGILRTAGSTAITNEAQAKQAWMALREERVTAMRELRTGLKKVANYAYGIYGENEAKMVALGLGVVGSGGGLGVLPAPGNLRSRAGKLTATIELRWKSVRGRSTYVAQCASDPAGPWTEVYNGPRVQATCDGLTSGGLYYFRSRAVGPLGPGAWSDITSARAS